MNTVGPLLIAGFDFLLFSVLFGGRVSVIFCFALGWAIGGTLWALEVWRRRRGADRYLEECERVSQQNQYLEERFGRLG